MSKNCPIKKQYRLVNKLFGKFHVYLYHDEKLILEKDMHIDEGLKEYEKKLQEQGYTYYKGE